MATAANNKRGARSQAPARRRVKYATVQAYLADVPPQPRRRLNTIRRLVRQALPDAVETISYNIPAFRRGRVFLYCAAFSDHVSIFPPVKHDAALVARLARYRNAKGNLLFGRDEPLPVALIARVVRALARQAAPAGRRTR